MSWTCKNMEIEFLPGTDVKEAIDESIVLATTNKCVVRFGFNGSRFVVRSGSSPTKLYNEYQRRSRPIEDEEDQTPPHHPIQGEQNE